MSQSQTPPESTWRRIVRLWRGPQLAPDGADDVGWGILGLRRRLLPSELERYQAREEFQWRQEPAEVQSLAFLLRMKHAEARVRGDSERSIGSIITMFAAVIALCAAAVTIAGWGIILTKGVDTGPVPSGLWELVVATSGAVILLAGVASGLFAAARSYYGRAREHDADMEWTRKVETSVRMSLISKCPGLSEEVREAIGGLGQGLLPGPAVELKDEPAAVLTPQLLTVLVEKLATQSESLIGLIKAVKGG